MRLLAQRKRISPMKTKALETKATFASRSISCFTSGVDANDSRPCDERTLSSELDLSSLFENDSVVFGERCAGRSSLHQSIRPKPHCHPFQTKTIWVDGCLSAIRNL